jgi:zinc transport system substrate-binding protein
MNKKQKIFLTFIIIVAVIAIGIVALKMHTPSSSSKLKVVTTFYPLTYLSQEIGGDQIQVTQLIPNNTEIHSWEPSASSIVATEDADIIIYNGAGADHWMEDDVLPALSNAKTRTVVDSTAGLELITNREQHPEPGEEHGIYDPHTWVSPYMAKLQAEKIYTELVQVDPEHESYYTQRWLTLENKLDQLDNEYLSGLSNASKDTIFVTHEAFGYLAYRYGFEQHGVIGLSADEQPSPTAIANIVDLMIEHETFVVYVDPVYSEEYAQTLKNELQTQTGHAVAILKLYLMLGPVDGKDYLQQQLFNLDSLKVGLEAS